MRHAMLALLVIGALSTQANVTTAGIFVYDRLFDKCVCPYYGYCPYRGWNAWPFYTHYHGVRLLKYPCKGQPPMIPGPPVGGYYYDCHTAGPGQYVGRGGFGAPY